MSHKTEDSSSSITDKLVAANSLNETVESNPVQNKVKIREKSVLTECSSTSTAIVPSSNNSNKININNAFDSDHIDSGNDILQARHRLGGNAHSGSANTQGKLSTQPIPSETISIKYLHRQQSDAFDPRHEISLSSNEKSTNSNNNNNNNKQVNFSVKSENISSSNARNTEHVKDSGEKFIEVITAAGEQSIRYDEYKYVDIKQKERQSEHSKEQINFVVKKENKVKIGNEKAGIGQVVKQNFEDIKSEDRCTNLVKLEGNIMKNELLSEKQSVNINNNRKIDEININLGMKNDKLRRDGLTEQGSSGSTNTILLKNPGEQQMTRSDNEKHFNNTNIVYKLVDARKEEWRGGPVHQNKFEQMKERDNNNQSFRCKTDDRLEQSKLVTESIQISQITQSTTSLQNNPRKLEVTTNKSEFTANIRNNNNNTIANNNNNVNNIKNIASNNAAVNNALKIVQRAQRPVCTVGSVYIQGPVQKLGKGNKVVVQQGQISQIVLQPHQGAQKMSTPYIVQQQHHVPNAQHQQQQHQQQTTLQHQQTQAQQKFVAQSSCATILQEQQQQPQQQVIIIQQQQQHLQHHQPVNDVNKYYLNQNQKQNHQLQLQHQHLQKQKQQLQQQQKEREQLQYIQSFSRVQYQRRQQQQHVKPIQHQNNTDLQIKLQNTSQTLPLQQQQQQHQKHQQSVQNIQYHTQGGDQVINTFGTIKYVNAQGNIIAPATANRYRTILQQSLEGVNSNAQQQSQPQQQQTFTTTTTPSNTNKLYAPQTTQPIHLKQVQTTTALPPNSVEDIIIVNGTHMSEEMSARILQSLSQRANPNVNKNSRQYDNNNSHYLQTSQPQMIAQHPIQHVSNQQTKQKQSGFYRKSSTYPAPLDHMSKIGPEYFRVNTSDIQAPSSTFADNIPLNIPQRGEDLLHYQQYQSNSNEQDEDIIGEEVRPSPIEFSVDSHLRALHALLQDHTYSQMPKQMTATNINLSNTSSSSSIQQAIPEITSTNILPQQTLHEIAPESNKKTTPNALVTTPVKFSLVSAPNRTSPFKYDVDAEKEEDAQSVISNSSRNNLDLDPGEETETAPEGEGEDDSVTRCICDLTHDDGYMICCDKCSVWQHVDCMGIDRQNIPEEYKCELCQPRAVDHNRARTIQLMKRKEQQNTMYMNSQQQSASTDANASPNSNFPDRNHLNTFSTINANKKKGLLTSKGRKNLFGGKSSPGAKYKRNEANSRSKKRENKKNNKRKLQHSSNTSPSSKQQTVLEATADKQSHSRVLVENYESAVTNHYSPELRARLHSIVKQTPSQTSTIAMLKNIGATEGKCAIVPHAGGKILISTLDISPNNPVIEIRGKYMLATQYKPNPSSQGPGHARTGSKFNHGPFLFFYRLPNDGPEICVDTRTYGNEARFVRRSCKPNAEILHSIDKGTLHLYIVSLNKIKSSTEITIKHESHDLEALALGEIASPTSTVCACGLIKDCIFGSSPTSNPSTPTSTQKKVSKRPNEQVKLKNTSAYKRKKLSNSKLNQSNSEQGVKEAVNKDLQDLNSTTTDEANSTDTKPNVSPLQNIPQEEPLDTDLSKTQSSLAYVAQLKSPEKNVEHLIQSKVDKANGSNLSSPILTQSSAAPIIPTTPDQGNAAIIPADATTTTTTVNAAPISPGVMLESSELVPNAAGSRSAQKLHVSFSTAHITDEPVSPQNTPSKNKSNPSEDINTGNATQNKLSTPTKSSQKKGIRKVTYSFSEDTSGTGDDSHLKKEKESKKETEGKKLTREERKMEAIVRAFEKMERSQQRKNEQKQNKTPNSSSSLALKKRSLYKGKIESEKITSKKQQHGKRKRKRGKAYHQPTYNKKRRSRLDSKNSDLNTSEESQLLSPKTSQSSHIDNEHLQSPKGSKLHQNKQGSMLADVGSAAGMLLSLSSYCMNKSSDNSLMSPDRSNLSMTEGSTPNTPPFPVSSACMLVEAAVGPFDSDFKLPNKTKTKKTIMNDWLHQGDTTEAYSPQSTQQLEAVDVQSIDVKLENKQEEEISRDQNYVPQTYETASGFVHSPFQEKPQNLSIVAKKVEEFIQLSSPDITLEQQSSSHDDEEAAKWTLAQSRASEQQSASSTPPLQLGSSVKKRWLRQAISEECTEDIIASTSTSSPPNGFTAPLKKRRVVRQCSNTSTENVLSPTQCSTFDSYVVKDYEEEQQHGLKQTQGLENDQELSEDDKSFNVTIKTEQTTEEYPVSIEEDVVTENKQPEPANDADCPIVEKVEIKSEIEDVYSNHSDTVTSSSKRLTPPPVPDKKSPTNDWENDNIETNEKTEEVPMDQIVLPKNEIEDIQQKLYSFHNENLMLLSMRNKKRVSRATTPTPSEDTTHSKDSTPVSTDSNKKKKNSFVEDFNPDVKREENGILSEENVTTTITANMMTTATSIYAQNNTLSNSTYNAYMYPNNTIQELNSHVPSQLYQQPMKPPPILAGVHPQLANSSIYHYLENPNRSNSYTSLNYIAPSTTIDPNNPQLRQHSLFTVQNPNIINSSNYFPKSYTTLSEPATATTASGSAPTTPTTVMPPKVLTRTQSADPRLNPPQNVQASNPKRKLSINEYRKRKQLGAPGDKVRESSNKQAIHDERKQQSTTPTTNSTPVTSTTTSPITPTTPPTPPTPPTTTASIPSELNDDDNHITESKSAASSANEEKEIVFNSAPTLLELQQENQSRRLKSYKSFTGISSPSTTELEPQSKLTDDNIDPEKHLATAAASTPSKGDNSKSEEEEDSHYKSDRNPEASDKGAQDTENSSASSSVLSDINTPEGSPPNKIQKNDD